jgi:hypothetical protein
VQSLMTRVVLKQVAEVLIETLKVEAAARDSALERTKAQLATALAKPTQAVVEAAQAESRRLRDELAATRTQAASQATVLHQTQAELWERSAEVQRMEVDRSHAAARVEKLETASAAAEAAAAVELVAVRQELEWARRESHMKEEQVGRLGEELERLRAAAAAAESASQATDAALHDKQLIADELRILQVDVPQARWLPRPAGVLDWVTEQGVRRPAGDVALTFPLNPTLLQTANEAYSAQLAMQKPELAALAEALNEQRAHMAAATTRIATVQDVADAAEATVWSLTVELEAARSSLRESAEAVTTLEVQLASSHAQRAAAVKEVKQAKKTIVALEAVMDDAEETAAVSTQTANAAAAQQMEAMQSELDNLASQAAQLQTELLTAQATRGAAEAALKAELAATQAAEKEAAAAAKLHSVQLEAAEAAVGEQRRQLEAAREAASSTTAHLKEHADAAAQLGRQLAATQAEATALRSETAGMQARLQADVDALRSTNVAAVTEAVQARATASSEFQRAKQVKSELQVRLRAGARETHWEPAKAPMFPQAVWGSLCWELATAPHWAPATAPHWEPATAPRSGPRSAPAKAS